MIRENVPVMTVPTAAIRAAALVLSCVEDQYDEDDWNVADDVVRAAAPLIAAAERDRLLKWMHRQAIELASGKSGLSGHQRSARDDMSQALIAAITHISAHANMLAGDLS